MNRVYPTKINWKNEEVSHDTPINSTNLNKMDTALYEIDGRVVTFDLSKANQSDLLQTVKGVTYDTETGIFTFTFWNGSTVTADLNIEKIPVSFRLTEQGVLIMTTADGTEYRCDIAALIKIYTFADSTEIDFTTTTDASGNKTVTAQIKAGSITGDKLQPNYLADCVDAKNSAESAATDADADALKAEGFAVGQQNGTDVPSTSPYYHNNAKYYCDEARTFTPEGYEELVQDVDELQDEMSDIYPTEVTDNEPYTLRQGKGDMVDMELVGGSFAWNQLVHGEFGSDYTTYWTVYSGTGSVSNGTLTVTDATGRDGVKLRSYLPLVGGHKYFINFEYTSTKAIETHMVIRNISLSATNTKTRYSNVVNYVEGTVSNLCDTFPKVQGEIATFTMSNVMCIDLTQLFGTTIADAIYAMEQATSGSGVAFFRQYFPNAYYAYDAGSIQSVNVASRKVFNSANNLIAEYPLPTTQLRGIPSLVNNKLVYDGDVLKSDGSVTRKYKAPIDLGSLEWVKAGNYNNIFHTQPSDIKSGVSGKIQTICASYLSVACNDFSTLDNYYDKVITVQKNASTLVVVDSAYSSSTASQFKTAMSGKYVSYVLAIPTTESAEPFQNPQRSDASGTEEFVDFGVSAGTRDVSIPVGTNSTYTTSAIIPPLEDYTDGATMSKVPISAIGTDESNNDKASQAYAQGDYFYKNGIAKAKTSIASGATFTLGTNYEIKTLAEILKALES